jgi:2-C-methyl-D-erythritol 4-phosphate cytidylyltransferase
MLSISLKVVLLLLCVLFSTKTVSGFTSMSRSGKTSSLASARSSPARTSKVALHSSLSGAVPRNVGVVLLAGGKGTRMKANMPKQFLPLLGKPIFLRSLDVFLSMNDIVTSIVIVLDESFRDEYQHIVDSDPRIRWADPGVERQGSVFNGLQRIPDSCTLVAIHDSARPLVTIAEVTRCLQDAQVHGAAVLGVKMKATVKESIDGEFVLRTIPRENLWEIHTPQVSTKASFLRGFKKVNDENLDVTDDVSVIEALGEPVKMTLGEYTNIKLTTPDDMTVAEQVLKERGVEYFDFDKSKEESALPASCPSVVYRESLEKKR